MNTTNRRKFITGSLAAAGVTWLARSESSQPRATPRPATLQPMGANERVRVAIVGLGNQGRRSHIPAYRKIANARIVAVCDPDSRCLREVEAELRAAGQRVFATPDVRRLLERDDIDAVSVVTPNYWHALITVWACQAGKHVYVEKPVSHMIWEGRQAVRAARRHQRLVQAGIQSRSNSALAESIEVLQRGELGRIQLVRGFCYKPRESIGRVDGAQVVPAEIDYDLWAGPTALRPLMRKRLHYDWHWDFETGNGDIGNQGPHEMDKARRFCGSPSPARRVISIGGRFGYDDDANTANTQIAYYDFGPKHPPILFEVRGLPERSGMKAMPHYRGVRIGNIVDCENGYWSQGWICDRNGKQVRQIKGEGDGSHWANFITAVRNGKQADVRGDIEDGHITAILSHQANISYRLGRRMPPAAIRSHIAALPPLADAFERMLEHLSANGVDTERDHATLGPWLEMDPQEERFTGPPEWVQVANAMLRRNDREPYVMPEEV